MSTTTAKTDQNGNIKPSETPNSRKSLSHTFRLSWNRNAKLAAAALGAVTLFYAAPDVASNVHDSLASCATSIGNRLPGTVSGWASSVGGAISEYLPSVSGVSTFCRGGCAYAPFVAMGTMAMCGTDGFDLSVQGRIRSEGPVAEEEEKSQVVAEPHVPTGMETSVGLWQRPMVTAEEEEGSVVVAS